MIYCSPYLSRKVRTPREACREIAKAHPERPRRNCQECGRRKLCEKIEQSMRSPACK